MLGEKINFVTVTMINWLANNAARNKTEMVNESPNEYIVNNQRERKVIFNKEAFEKWRKILLNVYFTPNSIYEARTWFLCGRNKGN